MNTKIREELEAAFKKCSHEFTFAELFAATNLNELSRKLAQGAVANMVQRGQIARVGDTRPARYRVAAPKKKSGDAAYRHSISLAPVELLEPNQMPWLTPPAREGALDFLACPSLIDGKRIPRRPPISGMVTEVSATSLSGIDARRLMF